MSNEVVYPIQEKSQCGVYAAWFVLSERKNDKVTPEQIARRMPWRIPFAGTLPWGIVKLLRHEGCVVVESNLKRLSVKEKEMWLREELQKGHMVVLLGKKADQQHYVVLTEYDVGVSKFTLYDPLVGKEIWSTEEVIKFWSGGGVFGFSRWYAIVVS